MRDVDGGALRAARGHHDRRVAEAVQRLHAHLPAALAHVRQRAQHLRLQRFERRATGLRLEPARAELRLEAVAARVAGLHEPLLGGAQRTRGRHVVQADGEAGLAGPVRAELGQARHYARGGCGAVGLYERGKQALQFYLFSGIFLNFRGLKGICDNLRVFGHFYLIYCLALLYCLKKHDGFLSF